MSWASSNAALPAAVSNAGGLGVLAAGPLRLEDFIRILDALAGATDKPYAVNIPLYRPQAAEILDVMVARQVPVVIASQGVPRRSCRVFGTMALCGSRWYRPWSTPGRPRLQVWTRWWWWALKPVAIRLPMR